MRTCVSTAIAVAIGLACAGSVFGQDKPGTQDKPAAAPPQAARPGVPLQIQIVISRYLGDKRVSTLPYTLSMSSTQGPQARANLRLNTEMPVPTTVFTPAAADGKQERTPLSSYTMRTVGTTIDVSCLPGSTDRRFVLTVAVQENWVRPADAGDRLGKDSPPVLQNYQSSNTVHVNDGETAQFTAATDRVTGEVIRVEVTARVLK